MSRLALFLFAILILSLLAATPSVAETEARGKLQNKKTGESAKPLKAGATIPSVQIVSAEKEPLDLKKVLENKPSILIFYRGGWCPFCNLHLAELGRIQPQLIELGYQIIAISPDRPEKLKESTDKHQLKYQLFSDSKMHASTAFGISFRLDDESVAKYKSEYGIDIEADSGETHHLLPVPSAYVVSKDGTIKFAYSNEDYKIRIESEKLLQEARSALKKQPLPGP